MARKATKKELEMYVDDVVRARKLFNMMEKYTNIDIRIETDHHVNEDEFVYISGVKAHRPQAEDDWIEWEVMSVALGEVIEDAALKRARERGLI